ncbi:MAG: glycosyltransferase family 4 protein [Deltaproteobacteria bacterium]|nr:glycosyltransferase family 4 protein [Deltaproteobacteria bacterium]
MTRKILLVTGIFPPDIGGPATYVPRIAEALTQRGHQITVITLSERLEHDDSSFPFKVIRLPRRLAKPLRRFKAIRTILAAGRSADVIFVNGLPLEAVLANMGLRRPLVMKVVGDLAWERANQRGWITENFEDFQRQRYGLIIEGLKALRSWWTRQADRVIVPSHYLGRWVAAWGVPEEKIAVIYNAVEPINGIKPVPVSLTTPLKAVTVGRLISLKRIDQVIEVLARMADLGLIIIGDGPERHKLESLGQRLAVNDRLVFAGQRTRQETFSLMAAADLFILNSAYEGLPHVVLEALNLGLPVVATAVGGTPEVVHHRKNGLLIRPGDAEGLRKAVQDISQVPERQSLSRGIKRSLKPFAFQQMLDRTECLLSNPY